MSGKKQPAVSTQRTEKGLEIPVPKREQVEADFDRLVPPVKKPKS
jgi:hypothetical protein